MITFEHLLEGLRFLKRSIKNKPFTQHAGNEKQICKAIIEQCWNGMYFQVSAGHFNEFYIRDLGWCAQALIDCGYKDRVYASMVWALRMYSTEGKITTTLTPRNKAIDVFEIAPDSLAYCLYILRLLNAKDLVKEFKPFLQLEINRYYQECINPITRMVKTERSFSSMKDNVKRKSSTYDNSMMFLASECIDFFKLENPFDGAHIRSQVMEHLWDKKEGFFYDDMNQESYIAGDAQVFPFFCGLCKDKEKLKKCIVAIRRAGLDDPLPLKYTAKRREKDELKPMKWLAPNYEGNAIWLHMGPVYVHLVATVDKKLALEYKKKYKAHIAQHKNFLEILNPDGTPFKTFFYQCDENMLWAVNYLRM